MLQITVSIITAIATTLGDSSC
ncbi:MAG: hypothetical protein J6I61_05235, partial [Prevotella sp.]|nr:hypothetical protein [Prevotella sp.]